MNAAIHEQYRENQILSAAPLELISLMLAGASKEIAKGRQALSNDDPREHAMAIGKALRILTELSLALNHEGGLEISRNLWRLYDYLQFILSDRTMCRDPKRLSEAMDVTADLADGFFHASYRLQSGDRSQVNSEF